ncbi:hypothetical protein IscW_ISCW016545 [Ixodes scapularis]|uniref:Uncharacterized protein n=1 Tax=Ixodes scapularis TaxID=6945 RepID=B7P1E2_IXOSC|nr:hypothetical protein IscW_ISCW016545 [Ixodes scapularis]|eukprot:XP_002433350.1 hypothetical protein IscW_ISCW016545 [Ixodes scapularis]
MNPPEGYPAGQGNLGPGGDPGIGEDMNMMPMFAPPEPEGIMDQILDFNPHRRTLEVFMMLAMIITIMTVGMFGILGYTIVETY